MTRKSWITGALIAALAICHVCLAEPGGGAAGEAVKTWGAALNPGGKAPTGSFRAFYINTNDPRTIIASEDVNDVAINYPWDAFHGIKSQDFGAYWVGWLTFRKDEARLIEVSQSWSKTRIIIDGKAVYEGGADARQPFTFTKGRHLVEVEFINNWHTTSLRVNFGATSMPLGRSEVLQLLQAPEFSEAEVHYVGLYESSAKDLTVHVHVAESAKPMILVLSSYDSVSWVIETSKPDAVRAVVYASFKPGSDVRGLDLHRARVIPLAGRVGSYDLQHRCSCVAGYFHCENSGNVLSTAAEVEALTGHPLATFSGAYGKDQMSVPGLAMTEDVKDQARTTVETEREQAAKCAHEADPDFNKMFDKPAGGSN